MRWDIVALEAEFRDTHKKITQLSKRPSSRYLYQFFVFKINIINISNQFFFVNQREIYKFLLMFFSRPLSVIPQKDVFPEKPDFGNPLRIFWKINFEIFYCVKTLFWNEIRRTRWKCFGIISQSSYSRKFQKKSEILKFKKIFKSSNI